MITTMLVRKKMMELLALEAPFHSWHFYRLHCF